MNTNANLYENLQWCVQAILDGRVVTIMNEKRSVIFGIQNNNECNVFRNGLIISKILKESNLKSTFVLDLNDSNVNTLETDPSLACNSLLTDSHEYKIDTNKNDENKRIEENTKALIILMQENLLKKKNDEANFALLFPDEDSKIVSPLPVLCKVYKPYCIVETISKNIKPFYERQSNFKMLDDWLVHNDNHHETPMLLNKNNFLNKDYSLKTKKNEDISYKKTASNITIEFNTKNNNNNNTNEKTQNEDMVTHTMEGRKKIFSRGIHMIETYDEEQRGLCFNPSKKIENFYVNKNETANVFENENNNKQINNINIVNNNIIDNNINTNNNENKTHNKDNKNALMEPLTDAMSTETPAASSASTSTSMRIRTFSMLGEDKDDFQYDEKLNHYIVKTFHEKNNHDHKNLLKFVRTQYHQQQKQQQNNENTHSQQQQLTKTISQSLSQIKNEGSFEENKVSIQSISSQGKSFVLNFVDLQAEKTKLNDLNDLLNNNETKDLNHHTVGFNDNKSTSDFSSKNEKIVYNSHHTTISSPTKIENQKYNIINLNLENQDLKKNHDNQKQQQNENQQDKSYHSVDSYSKQSRQQSNTNNKHSDIINTNNINTTLKQQKLSSSLETNNTTVFDNNKAIVHEGGYMEDLIVETDDSIEFETLTDTMSETDENFRKSNLKSTKTMQLRYRKQIEVKNRLDQIKTKKILYTSVSNLSKQKQTVGGTRQSLGKSNIVATPISINNQSKFKSKIIVNEIEVKRNSKIKMIQSSHSFVQQEQEQQQEQDTFKNIIDNINDNTMFDFDTSNFHKNNTEKDINKNNTSSKENLNSNAENKTSSKTNTAHTSDKNETNETNGNNTIVNENTITKNSTQNVDNNDQYQLNKIDESASKNIIKNESFSNLNNINNNNNNNHNNVDNTTTTTTTKKEPTSTDTSTHNNSTTNTENNSLKSLVEFRLPSQRDSIKNLVFRDDISIDTVNGQNINTTTNTNELNIIKNIHNSSKEKPISSASINLLTNKTSSVDITDLSNKVQINPTTPLKNNNNNDNNNNNVENNTNNVLDTKNILANNNNTLKPKQNSPILLVNNGQNNSTKITTKPILMDFQFGNTLIDRKKKDAEIVANLLNLTHLNTITKNNIFNHPHHHNNNHNNTHEIEHEITNFFDRKAKPIILKRHAAVSKRPKKLISKRFGTPVEEKRPVSEVENVVNEELLNGLSLEQKSLLENLDEKSRNEMLEDIKNKSIEEVKVAEENLVLITKYTHETVEITDDTILFSIQSNKVGNGSAILFRSSSSLRPTPEILLNKAEFENFDGFVSFENFEITAINTNTILNFNNLYSETNYSLYLICTSDLKNNTSQQELQQQKEQQQEEKKEESNIEKIELLFFDFTTNKEILHIPWENLTTEMQNIELKSIVRCKFVQNLADLETPRIKLPTDEEIVLRKNKYSSYDENNNNTTTINNNPNNEKNEKKQTHLQQQSNIKKNKEKTKYYSNNINNYKRFI